VRRVDTEFDGQMTPQQAVQWARALRRLQKSYDEALDRAEDARRRRDDLLRRQAQFQAELNQIAGQLPGAQSAADTARSQAVDLFARLEEHRDARDAATARLLGLVPTSHPLVLLPVRLETRFVSRQGDDGGVDLLIRIYPDDIHIDSHEPGLTDEEETWGRQYWVNTAAAGGDGEQQRLAWYQLADRFGVRRAAWIARLLDPARPGAITRREAAWTRAPHTTVLPDRWVATGYRGGRSTFTAWGNAIPDQLATGLTPRLDAELAGGDLPPIDLAMRWMIDFEVALEAGMGLRIPLSADQVENGIDRLLVTGVKSTLDADGSALRLAGLLDAQHYTHDLAFVPQNTPTNNTADAPSGYLSGDPGNDRDFAVERAAPLVAGGDGSDGDALGAAFGIEREVFAHVRGADRTEMRAARAMNATLWPSLDSRLLRQLSSVSGGALRDRFVDDVRARGPLPSIRVGNQPYGILPVVSLARWRSSEENDPGSALATWCLTRSESDAPYRRGAPRVASGIDMPTLLRQDASSCRYVGTRPAALSAGADAPLLVQRSIVAPDDPASLLPPDPNYLTLLRQSDAATIEEERYPGWDARNAAKPHALLYLLLRASALSVSNAPAPEVAAFRQRLADLENRSVGDLQFLLAETIDTAAYRVDAWATSLATTRLTALRQGTPLGVRLGGYGWLENLRPGEPLRLVPPPPGDTGGPIFASDRNKGFVHAPSLAHAGTAAVLRSGYLSHKEDSDGDALAVDLSSERVHRAHWLLEGVRQGQSLGALLGYRFERGLHDNGLDRFIFPFRALAGLKSEDDLAAAYQTLRDAEALAQEVGDLYRRSADALARADQARLQKQQREAERQQYQNEIEASTALEALARAADSRAVALADRIAAHSISKPRSGTVQKPGNVNFDVEIIDRADVTSWTDALVTLQQERQQAVFDAALAHDKFNDGAATRAINQARIQALNDPARPDSIPALAAKIASEEAAAAALDGQAVAREGTRGKAEGDLALARAALGARLAELWQQALESLAANNVVDGLELQRRWRTGTRRQPPDTPWDATTIPFGNAALGFPAEGSSDFAAIDAQLRALDETVDAVGDVVLAESVYHLVQGNPLRSGATLDAIATGKMAPPELEVTRTPRTGIGLTHRLVVLASASAETAALLAPWTTNADQMRAPAEPLLNAWAARLLGDPGRVRCRAELLDSDGDQVLAVAEVTLDRLQLSPLDVVFAAEGNGEAHRSELEQRVVHHLLQTRPAAVPPDAAVRLAFARDPAWPADIVSFGELVEIARTVRKLFAGARAIDGRDLSLPEAPGSAAVDTAELKTRAERAVNALQQAQQTLQALFPPAGAAAPNDASGADALRAALIRMAHFGIQGAVPVSAAGDSAQARISLLVQGQSIAKEIAQRLDRIGRLAVPDPSSAQAETEYHLSRIREVFGPDFRVLPHVRPANAAVLKQAFGDSVKIQDGDPLAAVTWFQRAARVRDGIARLDVALLYAEALGNGARLGFQVGQLPYVEQDRWVALPLPADSALAAGRLSLVAHMALQSDMPFDEPLAGLLIDEWVEVVPSRTETTAVTFHYDQPGACPPQAVLVAVPSDDERTVWDLDILDSVLNETLDLAQARALLLDGRTEGVWVEDRLPAGSVALGDGESWTWIDANPAPLSGTLAHQSAQVAGIHQHYFQDATETMSLEAGEVAFAYVFLDPEKPPSEVMLQWNDGSWEHRAYWGANNIPWGTDGTVSRRFMGPLPPSGEWIRLDVPVELVGLEDREVSGMAFALCDGRASWDRAGKAWRPSLLVEAEAIDLSRATETEQQT
jgi:hypothetical protein